MESPSTRNLRKNPQLLGPDVDCVRPLIVRGVSYTGSSQFTPVRGTGEESGYGGESGIGCGDCYQRRVDQTPPQEPISTYSYGNQTEGFQKPLRCDNILLDGPAENSDTESSCGNGHPAGLSPGESPRLVSPVSIGDTKVNYDPLLGRGQPIVLTDISNRSRKRNSLLISQSRTVHTPMHTRSLKVRNQRSRIVSLWPRTLWNSLCQRSQFKKPLERAPCCSYRKQRWSRHLCACLRRLPRRVFRLVQWCYGRNQQHSMCFGLCDFYSLVLSVIILTMIVRDRMTKYCTAVRYSSDSFCSERYVSFDCNFNNRDFLDDDELFTRCGVHGGQTIKPHTNNTIETMCGPNTPLMGSLKMVKKESSEEDKKLYKVPNIVHYTLDCNESKRFDYVNYLSVVSVEKFINPNKIYIHCNCFLNTDWWFNMLEEVKNVYVVRREFPEYIQASKPRWIHDRSDVIKLQTLFHNGGIHLDLDVLIVQPLTKLRAHDLVVGRHDGDDLLGDGVLLSKPHSPMVCLWMNGYRQYDPWPWQRSHYSLGHLERLVETFPKHVHVVGNLLGPGLRHTKSELYEGDYNWRDNFAIKLWQGHIDGLHMPENAEEARNITSNFGELVRHVMNPPPTTPRPTTTTNAPNRRKKKKVKRAQNKKVDPKKSKSQGKQ